MVRNLPETRPQRLDGLKRGRRGAIVHHSNQRARGLQGQRQRRIGQLDAPERPLQHRNRHVGPIGDIERARQ
jgi:hypothetical protein